MKMYPNMFNIEERMTLKFVRGIKERQAEKQATMAKKISQKQKKVGFRKGDKRKEVVFGDFDLSRKKDGKDGKEEKKIGNGKIGGKNEVIEENDDSNNNLNNKNRKNNNLNNNDGDSDDNGDIFKITVNDNEIFKKEKKSVGFEDIMKKSGKKSLKGDDDIEGGGNFRKKTPFDSYGYPGLKYSNSDIKYVGGIGQSNDTTIELE